MTEHLLSHYLTAGHGYDEMFDKNGHARAHWSALLAHVADETPDEMRQRIAGIERQVHKNGVTYNVYADPQGMQRPWGLDVLPFILPANEWASIELAVRQRATLLNRILIDVYGPQKIVAEGLLPPALVHGHSGFLRPCHGIEHFDDVALHLIAVDLARSPDGRWWAVRDRTQAPSGAGYALENRSVIARAFPDLLRELKIQPINGFFDTLRDSLMHWGRQCLARHNESAAVDGRHDDAMPLIVLLTPGQFNETYYEQTYLARQLGFPLVEGKDLTVRNGYVWLKTLSGPQRVHVILRRVDDDFCDPIELRADSTLGVAGLTDAARRGNVIIANGLGSNLLESGALLGYLPALCRRLLGETLRMPSVATWWCGEPAALESVIEDLSELIIKPAFPQLRQATIFGQDLNATERAALIARMRAQPQNYVAQELVRFSQAPVWRENAASTPPAGLAASAVGLRVFACATPNGYVVMPGALTRVATGPDARIINMQLGGASKDTWIQSGGRAHQFTLPLRSTTSNELVRSDTHLSSRVVENLFWLGRYSERCDNMTRLLRVALDFLLNVAPEYRGGEWQTVQSLCQWFGLIGDADEDDVTLLADAEIESELLHAVVDQDGPGLAGTLQQLYRVSSHLRERLSVDNWRVLNDLLQRNDSNAPFPNLADAISLLDESTSALMTLSGFALDGMTRDNGWRFMSIGRRLERLQFLCTVLQHGLSMPAHSSLDWLLEVTDSIVTYRARYMAQPEWLPVLDLLIMDDSNPRSVTFQLLGLIKYLDRLAVIHGPCGSALLAPLLTRLQTLDPDRDLHWDNRTLQTLLTNLSAASFALSEQIGLQFFSYTGEVNEDTFVT